MYDKFISSFSAYWESFLDSLPDILVALVILTIFVVMGKLLNRLFRRRIEDKWKDRLVSSFIAQIIKWIFYIIGIILAFDIVGFGKIAASMVAGMGLSAIIFGFAFKDIAENFLSGMLIAFNRPFKVGDIIQVGSSKGPIRSIDLRNTHIRTYDGRDIFIPNSMMIKDVLTNYTRDGLIRLEFIAGLDMNDDLDRARNLIMDYMHSNEQILKEPEPNVIVENLGLNSVDLKVFFWINLFTGNPEEQMLIGEPIRSLVMREVKDLLLSNGFSLPSNILEHKIYNKEEPLPVKVSQ